MINLTEVIGSKNGKWHDTRGSTRVKDMRVQSSATKVLSCPLGAIWLPGVVHLSEAGMPQSNESDEQTRGSGVSVPAPEP